MLHIATVHYSSPRWIEIQASYLREHLPVPYQTWASLELIDESYAVHFDRVIDQVGRHSDKLNHLAIEISHEADEDDLLMFLDGDAFPVADPMPLINDGLANAPLIAVCRAENLDDRQPHPCFCVTTVGAWRRLPGDWSQGYRWTNNAGEKVSDVGGNLLRQLELTNTPWVPVLRSNHTNLDPVLYAIYGEVVYHHGAAFRTVAFPTNPHASRAGRSLEPDYAPVPRTPVLRQLVRRDNWRKRRAWEHETYEHRVRQSELVREKIAQGGSDWLADFM